MRIRSGFRWLILVYFFSFHTLGAQDCLDTTHFYEIHRQIEDAVKQGGEGREMDVLDSIEQRYLSCPSVPERWMAVTRLQRAEIIYHWGYTDAADSLLTLATELSYSGSGFDFHMAKCHLIKAGILIRREEFFQAVGMLRALLINIPDEGRSNRILRMNGLNRLGIAYKRLGLADQSLSTYREGRAIATSLSPPALIMVSQFLGNEANTHTQIGNFERSIALTKESLSVLAKLNRRMPADSARLFNNIGYAYHCLEQYDQALSYLTRSIALRSKNGLEYTDAQMTSLSLRAGVYVNADQYALAKEDIERAVQILGKTPSSGDLGSAYSLLYQYELFDQLGEPGAMLPIYESVQGLADMKFAQGVASGQLVDLYNLLGVVSTKLISPEAAIANYQKALTTADLLPQYRPNDLANTYGNLAVGYLKANELDSGYHYASLAMEIAMPDREVSSYLYGDRAFPIYSILHAANLALDRFQRDGNLEELIFERERVAFIIELLDAFQHFSKQHSWVHHSLYAKNILALAAEMDWQIALTTGDRNYYSRIIELSERTKNFAASSSLKRDRALGDVAIESLRQEAQLRSRLTEQSIRQKEARLKGATLEELDALDLGIAELRDSLLTFQRSLDLRVETEGIQPHKVPSIQDMQAILPSTRHGFLGFLVTEESVFVTLVKKDTFEVVRVVKDSSYLFTLQAFYGNLLSDDHTKPGKDYAAFAHAARSMYRLHLEPLEGMLPEQLIVLPDPALGQLPIELFFTKDVPDTEIYRPERYPYCLYNHFVSYALNTALYQRSTSPPNWGDEGGILLAAPFTREDFTDDRGVGIGSLPPIPDSEMEVVKIGELLAAKPLLGAHAPEAVIKQQLAGARIAHLSTHGLFSLTAPDKTGLLFYTLRDSIENEILYLSEIYDLRLQMDLLVLSACETGLGRKAQGEGSLSVSRAFQLAGARTVVATQWMVRGKETTDLMVKFYTLLKAGESKVAALNKAKRWFIAQNSGPRAHPYYWGGAALSGHTGGLR